MLENFLFGVGAGGGFAVAFGLMLIIRDFARDPKQEQEKIFEYWQEMIAANQDQSDYLLRVAEAADWFAGMEARRNG